MVDGISKQYNAHASVAIDWAGITINITHAKKDPNGSALARIDDIVRNTATSNFVAAIGSIPKTGIDYHNYLFGFNIEGFDELNEAFNLRDPLHVPQLFNLFNRYADPGHMNTIGYFDKGVNAGFSAVFFSPGNITRVGGVDSVLEALPPRSYNSRVLVTKSQEDSLALKEKMAEKRIKVVQLACLCTVEDYPYFKL